ncbi:MAG: DNA-binding response regulator [Arcobacter sp.]|nr:MAG: DNA-binding response regulator [Arcobacter sp.]
MKILLLEDDYLYKISIKEYLEDIDFNVDDFENGNDALDAIYENTYDLLLLDIRIPGMDGFELVQTIRKDQIKTPVIILTSLTDISNLSKGYELGCNDYLKKPFDLLELKYRIDQLVQSKCFDSNENFIKLYDIYKFDIQKNILYKNEKIVDLTQKESEVVSLLIQNRGIYVSIESLHEVIWENKDIQYADIRMCIKRLRDKTDKNFILNKRFVGYKIDK